jgi:hypothetical protein
MEPTSFGDFVEMLRQRALAAPEPVVFLVVQRDPRGPEQLPDGAGVIAAVVGCRRATVDDGDRAAPVDPVSCDDDWANFPMG